MKTMKMKMKKRLVTAIATLLILGGSTAFAAPKLTVTITAQKEVTTVVDGKSATALAAADTGYPGDTLVYTLSYENVGDSNAVGASFVDPIPPATSYVAGSATVGEAELTFSADGGKNYMPDGQVTYKATDAEGKEIDKAAAPEAYTHIKWKVEEPIPPQGTGSFQFKTTVK
jgi:uncharacterized repeat protein (TIGR01451 family)